MIEIQCLIYHQNNVNLFCNLEELDSIEHGFSCFDKFFLKYEYLISASDFSDFMHN